MRRLRWILARLFMLGALAVVALLAALRIEHSISIDLPTPTGPFPVGRIIGDWVDDSTSDSLAPAPGTKRELLAWIWYPAAPASSAAPADYMPAPLREAVEHDLGPLLGGFLTRDLAKVHAHSTADAPVSPRQSFWPVVIFRAGASGEVVSYSTLAEDLASHGYVVVGLDAPWRTFVVAFPDGRVARRTPQNNPELCFEKPPPEQGACVGRQLNAWTSDIGFALDRVQQLNASDASGRFTGRLDMTRIGVFGHSFGGAQAAQFCSQDARCKAGIDIDGALIGSVIRTGIHKPFFFLLSGLGDFSSDAESRQIMADIRSVYNRQPADSRLLLSIRGANHFTFSDDGALLKSHILRGAFRVIGMLGIDGPRQLAVTADCVRTFFDAHLKGTGASPASVLSPRYPELEALR